MTLNYVRRVLPKLLRIHIGYSAERDCAAQIEILQEAIELVAPTTPSSAAARALLEQAQQVDDESAAWLELLMALASVARKSGARVV